MNPSYGEPLRYRFGQVITTTFSTGVVVLQEGSKYITLSANNESKIEVRFGNAADLVADQFNGTQFMMGGKRSPIVIDAMQFDGFTYILPQAEVGAQIIVGYLDYQ